MKINIGHSISEFLKFENQVSIPGLGSFRLQPSQQSFQLGDGAIHPPFTKITFSEETRSDQRFPEFIKRKYQISKKKAEKAIKRFSTRILNNLLNLGRATINGLGHLEHNENRHVVFFPQPEAFAHENYGLPEITISPITRSFEEKRQKFAVTPQSTSAVIASEQLKVNRKEVFPPIFLFLIIIILLFLLAWWFVNQNSPQKVTDPVVATEKKEELSAQDEADIEKIIEEFYEDSDRVEEEISGNTQDEEISESIESEFDISEEESFSEVELDPLDEAAPEKEIDLIESEIESTEELRSLESNAPERDDDSPNRDLEEPFGQIGENENEALDKTLYLGYADPILNEYQDVITNKALNIGCVIVVGSFKNKKNAYKLRDQMMRKGYKVYTEQHNEWTRIGLLFNCKDNDLVENIQSIRKNIEKMAWYLIPDFEVPRE